MTIVAARIMQSANSISRIPAPFNGCGLSRSIAFFSSAIPVDHSAPTPRQTKGFLFLILIRLDFADNYFRRNHEPRHRCGILQRNAHHFCRVDYTTGDKVAIL